jgi:hypothetical protein
MTDRDEALRDDFHLESTYDYGEEDEWDDDEANWNAEEEEETGETSESKDESTAYLNFLNEEVCTILRSDYDITLMKQRPRSLAERLMTSRRTILARTLFCSSRRSTRLSLTNYSAAL